MKCSETGTGRLHRRGRGDEMEKCQRCQTKNRMEIVGLKTVTSDGFDVLAEERSRFARGVEPLSGEGLPTPPRFTTEGLLPVRTNYRLGDLRSKEKATVTNRSAAP